MGIRDRFVNLMTGGKVAVLEQQIELMKQSLTPRHFQEDNNLPYREDSYRLVNGEDFLTLYENHVPTYACVDAIARNCAKIPMKIYRKDDLRAGKKKHEAEISEYSTDEVEKSIWSLFMNPNPWQTNFEFRYAIMATAELTGMSYVEKSGRDESRIMLPEQLWVLRTDWMRSIPSQHEFIDEYNYQTSTGAYIKYSREEIFEYKYWHPRSEFYGLSPIRPAQNSVIIDLYCIKYAKQFFKNGGHIGKYVSIKEKLQEHEFKRMSSEIQTFLGGLEQAHKIPLLEGDAKLNEIGQDPESVALVKTRGLNLNDICMSWGVPPIILGLPNETHYNNADIQKKVFYEETVIPKNHKLLCAFNQTFLEPLGFVMDYDYSGIDVLQPNIEKKANTSAKLIQARIMTPNEVRKEFWQLDPLEGGDKFPDVVSLASIGSQPDEGAMSETKTLDNDTVKLIDSMVNLKLQKALKIREKKDGGAAMGGQVAGVMTDSSDADFVPTGTMAGQERPHRHFPGSRGVGRPGTPIKGRYHKSLKKAHIASADKLYNTIYPVMHGAILNGWKSLQKATIEAINKVEKSGSILIKKDYVQQVLGIMDNETLKMAKELTQLEQGQVEHIIAAEKARTGKTIPKSRLADVTSEINKDIEKNTLKGLDYVSDTIKGKVETTLNTMLDEGKSPAEIADSINEIFEGDDYGHAKTISRTESIKFVNGSRAKTLEGMGFSKKQWFHSGHTDAREDHLAADGEIVDMDEPFSTGLMYPGDPDGEPEDVINCGCTFAEAVSRISDEEEADLGGFDEGEE